MKRLVLFAMVLVLFTVTLSAQDAASIIYASRHRITSTTIQTRSRMVITNKDGSTSERIIDQYSKDGSAGNNRIVIIFQSPASVKNTRFLTIENQSKAEDRWIFLPSLGKVRRIAASEGSGSFMGTDLSYDDISSTSRDVNLDTHTILREENFNGRSCYVIESKPKDSGYQYSKMVSWIEKASSLLYKIELYDKKGTLVKILEMSKYENVQGRLTAKQTKMTTVTAGTSTIVNIDIIKYDDNIPESVFTTGYLESGKAN